jgi:hypothetical protein
MVRLARVAVAIGLLAACGGGGGGSSSPPAESQTTSTTTTNPRAAEIDLSQPIPAGSLHGTPRPPLENTGDDYVAIFESLTRNFRWLTENPDVEVLDELFVAGTPTYDLQADLFHELLKNRWRAADDGYRLDSVEVAEATPEYIALRVSDTIDFEQIVDSDGDRVGSGVVRGTEDFVITLAPNAQGRWLIASVAAGDQTTVEL